MPKLNRGHNLTVRRSPNDIQVLNGRDKIGKFGREIRVQIFSLSLSSSNNTINPGKLTHALDFYNHQNVTVGPILHHKTWERYESASIFHDGEAIWQILF